MDIDWEELDKEKIMKALEFATEKHKYQYRATGAEYITHPITVAELAEKLMHETDVVVAALLHDTIEDTDTTLDEIREEFGEDVAFLVDGLSKDKSIKSKKERNEKYWKKLEEYGEKDERIWIIKFSDIFHNVQTIEKKSEDSGRNYLKKLDQFFIPKAEELGWKNVRKVLEEEANKLAKRIK